MKVIGISGDGILVSITPIELQTITGLNSSSDSFKRACSGFSVEFDVEQTVGHIRQVKRIPAELKQVHARLKEALQEIEVAQNAAQQVQLLSGKKNN